VTTRNYQVMFEVWQHVPGSEGRYEVSSRGQVWSNRTNRLLSLSIANTGYIQVNIAGSVRHVQRLVLEAFIGPCPYGHEACHGNGVRTDNRLENLRWDTRKGNMADASRHGTTNRGERCPTSKLTREQVQSIRAASGSQQEIAGRFGVSREHVRDIRSGKRWGWLQ
jgi:hypothetical protein